MYFNDKIGINKSSAKNVRLVVRLENSYLHGVRYAFLTLTFLVIFLWGGI
jgi:hypothetical protein